MLDGACHSVNFDHQKLALYRFSRGNTNENSFGLRLSQIVAKYLEETKYSVSTSQIFATFGHFLDH
jgi:hypothetical protein